MSITKMFLYSFLFITMLSCAQEQGAKISDKIDSVSVVPAAIIPFTLTEHNNIIIQAVLNHADTLDLMFHTGVNSVSLTAEANERIKTRHAKKSSTVKSWGGEQTADYSDNNTLSIGAFHWDSLRVWIGEKSGHFTEGKFGPNLFDHKIMELDFEKQVLMLYDTLPSLEDYQKFELSFDRGSMFIEGNCQVGSEVYENAFMIHSGYSGTLLLDDGFSSQHNLSSQLKVISERQLSDSYGNVLKTKKAILPGLKIASFQLDTVPIAFFEGKIGNQQHSVMGGELIKRFNIILDIKKSTIYLKPNSLMALPLEDV